MASTAISSIPATDFAPMSATRLLIVGGIGLILAGMLFGDIFAVFVLHQNGGRTGEALLAAARVAADRDGAGVRNAFASVGGLLEDRGTKIDTHVHMTDAGYLALLLALMQPYVALPSRRKKRLAQTFLAGSVMLPVGIFLIHYVGLAHSPSSVIGWGIVLADAGGAVLIVALAGEIWGFWKYHRGEAVPSSSEAVRDGSWPERALLGGGTLLILLGFLYGAWYAAFDLYPQERAEVRILTALSEKANAKDSPGISAAVDDYGALAASKAVSVAAHSHIIEFGMLALLLSFVQPYVFLSESWKRRWVIIFLAGSVLLPVFVLLELKMGLIAGGIADIGGLLVIIALLGMLTGILRYTGRADALGTA
jgi:hypothetical protein